MSFGQESKKVKDEPVEAAGNKYFKRYLDTCGGYDFTNLIPLLFGNFRWTKEDFGMTQQRCLSIKVLISSLLGPMSLENLLRSFESGLFMEINRGINILLVLSSDQELAIPIRSYPKIFHHLMSIYRQSHDFVLSQKKHFPHLFNLIMMDGQTRSAA